MNDKLTIEECEKSIDIYENNLEYSEYLLKVVKHNKEELENSNFILETSVKLLKFMQKQGFKLDVDFDKYNNEVQKCIKRNNHAFETEININIEKRISEIEVTKIKIMELSQVSGFLRGIVSRPIRNKDLFTESEMIK